MKMEEGVTSLIGVLFIMNWVRNDFYFRRFKIYYYENYPNFVNPKKCKPEQDARIVKNGYIDVGDKWMSVTLSW